MGQCPQGQCPRRPSSSAVLTAPIRRPRRAARIALIARSGTLARGHSGRRAAGHPLAAPYLLPPRVPEPAITASTFPLGLPAIRLMRRCVALAALFLAFGCGPTMTTRSAAGPPSTTMRAPTTTMAPATTRATHTTLTTTARSAPPQSSTTGASGISPACEKAWAQAQRTSDFQDTAKTYQATFTSCTTITEWIAGNMAHGDRLADSDMAIANFCAQLRIHSTLCTAAAA